MVGHMTDYPALFFGRAFDAQGRVVLPCFQCGTPLWGPPHECIGQDWRNFEAAVQELLEGGFSGE